MNSVTLWLLLVAASSSTCAFIAYWAGVGAADKRHKAREQQLLDALDDSVETIQHLCRDRHPAGKDQHSTPGDASDVANVADAGSIVVMRPQSLKKLNGVMEVADYLRCGRTHVFALIKSGDLQSVKVARRRLVPDTAVHQYVNKLEASGHLTLVQGGAS